MANRKLTDLPELSSIDNNDWVYTVDVSDVSESPEGTSKKILKSNLMSGSGGLTVFQVPRRLSFATLNTWYSHYMLSNQSWLDGTWSWSSGTGATPTRAGTNFQNTNALRVQNMTSLDSLEFYVRRANIATYEVIIYSYDYSSNDGNEINEQILVQESFSVPANSISHIHSFTINAHTLSADSIIQVFMRNTATTGNLDNPQFRYNFS